MLVARSLRALGDACIVLGGLGADRQAACTTAAAAAGAPELALQGSNSLLMVDMLRGLQQGLQFMSTELLPAVQLTGTVGGLAGQQQLGEDLKQVLSYVTNALAACESECEAAAPSVAGAEGQVAAAAAAAAAAADTEAASSRSRLSRYKAYMQSQCCSPNGIPADAKCPANPAALLPGLGAHLVACGEALCRCATTLAVWSCVGRVSCSWWQARAVCAPAAGGSVVQ
jgi:hypothetical protein